MRDSFLFKLKRRDSDFDVIERLNRETPAGAVHVFDAVRKHESRCFFEIALMDNVFRFVIFTQQYRTHDVASMAVQKQVPMLTADLHEFEFPRENVAEFLHADHADGVPFFGPFDKQAVKFKRSQHGFALSGSELINEASFNLEGKRQLELGAVDQYESIRDFYHQYREGLVYK